LEEKRKAEVEAIARLDARLGNKSYVDNAPETVVAQTRAQLEEAQTRLASIKAEQARFL
jgi:valyl-tRNA synthetase